MNRNRLKVFISIFFLFVFIHSNQIEFNAEQQEDMKVVSYTKTKIKSYYDVKVTMNLVDVIVLDKNGNHVTDLKPEDFKIYEDGTERQIAKVDVVNTLKKVEKKIVREKAPDNLKKYDRVEVKSDRYFAFMIANLPFHEAKKSQIMTSLNEFISSQVQPKDQLALFHVTRDNIRRIINFDSDKKAFMVNFLGYLSGDLFKQNPFVYQNPFVVGKESSANLSAAVGAYERRMIPGFETFGERIQKERMNQQNDVFLRVMKNTKLLASSLRNIYGRKNIILFTSGIYNWPEIVKEVAADYPDYVLKTERPRKAVVESIQELNKMLNAYNISLYVIDVGKVYQKGVDTNLFEIEENKHGLETKVENARTGALRDTAAASGGDFYFNAANTKDKLMESLTRINYETSFYYNLSYYANEKQDPGSYLNLKVEVNRDDVTIKHRDGIMIPRTYKQLSSEERDIYIRDSIFSAVPQNNISLSADARIFPTDGDESLVLFSLEAPVKEVIHEESDNPFSQIQASCMIFLQDGTQIKQFHKTLHLDLQEGTKSNKDKLRYFQFVLLPPGKYTARYFMADLLDGKTVNTELSMVIPEFGDGELALGSILPMITNEKIFPISEYAPLPGTMQRKQINPENPLYFNNNLLLHKITAEDKPTNMKDFFITIRDKNDIIKTARNPFKLTLFRIKDNKLQKEGTNLNSQVLDIVKHNNKTKGILFRTNLIGIIPAEYLLKLQLKDNMGRTHTSTLPIKIKTILN